MPPGGKTYAAVDTIISESTPSSLPKSRLMCAVRLRYLEDNQLAALPAGLFDGLDALYLV